MTLCRACRLPLVIERTPDNHHPWCKETPMSRPFSPDPGTGGTAGASTRAFLITVAIVVLAVTGGWAWIGR